MPHIPTAAATAAILALTATAATAQSTSGLTPVQIDTYAYDSMISWSERDMRPFGTEEVAEVEGKVFLDIRAILDVPWTDDLSRLSISSRDIVLVLPDGTEVPSCCAYEYWGMMHLNGKSASMSRPRDYPDVDEHLYWHSIFLVPEGTASARLEMRNDDGLPGFSGEVTVPEVGQEVPAAAMAAFTVSDSDLYRALATEDGSGDAAVTMSITAPPGQVFADVEITVAPFAANEFDSDPRFYFHTYDFRLLGLDGTTYPSIGERFSRKILDWQFNGVNPGDETERRMIWMVPEGTEEATLVFGATPVALVSFDGSVADEG